MCSMQLNIFIIVLQIVAQNLTRAAVDLIRDCCKHPSESVKTKMQQIINNTLTQLHAPYSAAVYWTLKEAMPTGILIMNGMISATA